MGSNDESRSEIAFFDLETTVPTRPGQGFAILEFGAILVCPRKLVELHNYSTLVRPADISLINSLSVRCNGISPDAVTSAPSFSEIADTVFDILHGRIWAGHNILRFDCVRIREAFAEIGRSAPEPKGTIDSLALLTQRFGRRAGDMKMASLATYFGLGQQTHRSLDDVRMNIEVVKNCAAVLFLESSLPDIFTENSWVSPNAVTRSRSYGKSSPNGSTVGNSTPNSGHKHDMDTLSTPITPKIEENHPILSLMTSNADEGVNSETGNANPFDMGSLSNKITSESLQLDNVMEEEEEKPLPLSPEGYSGYSGFLEPEEVSLTSVTASSFQYYRGTQRIRLLHKDIILQLNCHVKVRFGVTRGKYLDFSGRPKLSFVANASPTLCQVLDACDDVAQKLSAESGSSSEWKSVVIRKKGFVNFPTVRLHIAIYVDSPRPETEIYKKESSGALEKVVFSQGDEATEIEALITSGISLDAYFSLDPYDYQKNAGIRLVVKKLVIDSN